MNWHQIQEEEDLQNAIDLSYQQPVMIFKHSTRCPVSFMAKRNVESKWPFGEDGFMAFYLDLISFRTLSKKIAEDFSIEHESPQIIVIKDGKAEYHASHQDIDPLELKQFV